jgi:SDR family mycofactocin-dependent oxidoreductase
MGRLTGKVALVTGGARGQGRAHAVRLAAEGADVVAFDICAEFASTRYDAPTPADLQETARLIQEQGRRAIVRQIDARDFAAVQQLVSDTVAELGRLDVVVVNHAISAYGYTWEISEEDWDEVVSVNLTGVWKVLKAVVPTMIAQGSGGSIVVTGSIAGLKGQPFLAHYVSSKHALVGLTKTLAVELGRHNIRVNAVHPGAVKTPMGGVDWNGQRGDRDIFRGALDDPEVAATLGTIFTNTLPEKSMEPDDVTNAVLFLACDESRYMTGAQVPIDFGAALR